MPKTEIAGWGNHPKTQAEFAEPASEADVSGLQRNLKSLIPRGAGRSYGDASLGSNILSTVKLNRTLSFDLHSGIICCQAGKMFSDILDEIVPNGFFLPVTPGTKFITVGGAIAADIHGKNHHVDGCFSEHVLSFRMIKADGAVVNCSRNENPQLFWATVGGMGLTGFILDATFKLKRISTSKIAKRTIKCENLKTLVER
jgi:FAD/FMN-containing dehydrogenase